jgi:hypothetical protein
VGKRKFELVILVICCLAFSSAVWSHKNLESYSTQFKTIQYVLSPHNADFFLFFYELSVEPDGSAHYTASLDCVGELGGKCEHLEGRLQPKEILAMWQRLRIMPLKSITGPGQILDPFPRQGSRAFELIGPNWQATDRSQMDSPTNPSADVYAVLDEMGPGQALKKLREQRKKNQ